MIKRRVQGLLQRSLGLQAYLFVFGLYAIATLRRSEPAFFHFLRLVPDWGVVLDIGANLGVTVTFLARKCPHAQVIAFEPVPWNYGNIKLMTKLLRLRNVSIQNCAAGNSTGVVDFQVPIVNGARMHALGHLVSVVDDRQQGEQLKVAICKLDDLGIDKVTAVKLDVENSEYEVFSGAVQMLQRCRPVIYCELWDNENRQKSFELLRSLHYTPHVVHSGRVIPFDRTDDPGQYFIFLPEQ
jgi:FkbM family methyltransferase